MGMGMGRHSGRCVFVRHVDAVNVCTWTTADTTLRVRLEARQCRIIVHIVGAISFASVRLTCEYRIPLALTCDSPDNVPVNCHRDNAVAR